jgi:hypothetical protein
MKKLFVFVLLLAIMAGMSYAEDQPTPTAALDIMFTDSLAFAGLDLELFLGPLGLGPSLTFLPFTVSGASVIFYEPGAFVHFYFGSPRSSLYLFVSSTYFTAFAYSNGQSANLEGGIFNVNGGLGFNAFLDKFRIGIELGYRYAALYSTATGTSYEMPFQIPIHFALRGGYGF